MKNITRIHKHVPTDEICNNFSKNDLSYKYIILPEQFNHKHLQKN